MLLDLFLFAMALLPLIPLRQLLDSPLQKR